MIMLTTIAIHNCNCINPRRKSNTPIPTQDVLPDADGGRGDSCSWMIMGMGNNYIRIQKEERGALSETDSDRNILDRGLCLIRY